MFTPDPDLYPFESKWFDSTAGRMHYLDEGEGPALLLCHGNPTWSFLYRDVIKGLRDRFRCVAADLHGFGLSERPAGGFGYTAVEHARTLGELVDHLGLDGFVLFGQDWGGPTGLTVAVERADRVAGVALGSTWYWPATAYFKGFSLFASSPPMQYLIRERNFFVEGFVPRGTYRKLSEREMDHYREVQPTPESRVGVGIFPRQIRVAAPMLATLERTVPERLGEKPALIFWGEKDLAFLKDRYVPRLSAPFSDREVVKLPNAAHFFQQDAPDAVVAAVKRRFA